VGIRLDRAREVSEKAAKRLEEAETALVAATLLRDAASQEASEAKARLMELEQQLSAKQAQGDRLAAVTTQLAAIMEEVKAAGNTAPQQIVEAEAQVATLITGLQGVLKFAEENPAATPHRMRTKGPPQATGPKEATEETHVRLAGKCPPEDYTQIKPRRFFAPSVAAPGESLPPSTGPARAPPSATRSQPCPTRRARSVDR